MYSTSRVLTQADGSNQLNPTVESTYSVLGPNYDTVVTTGAQVISDYDVLDHNSPATVQPDHPPPVGGVNEDQFYNAEDHMYAAVNKGAKKQKKKESNRSNGEDEN